MSAMGQKLQIAMMNCGRSCGVDAQTEDAVHEALARADADARALWAVRVLCAANANGNHISFPYPHRLGGFELINTPEYRRFEADDYHHGDTAELCLLNAAEAVFPELPESERARLGVRP